MKKNLDKLFAYNVDIFLVYFLININVIINLFLIGKLLYFKDTIILVITNTVILATIYLFNKLTDYKEDKINLGFDFQSKKRILLTMVAFGVALSFLVYGFLLEDYFWYWLMFVVLGFWYSYPPRWRLKEIFLIKNIMPAFCWTLSLSLLYKLNIQDYVFFDHIQAFAYVFLLFMLFEVLWDIPDREGDISAGVKTIPNIFGWTVVKFVLTTSFFLLAVLSVSQSIFTTLISLVISIFIINMRPNSVKQAYHILVLVLAFAYAFELFLDLLFK
jgi:4-hydroxybenzoate polyprenyltransferase